MYRLRWGKLFAFYSMVFLHHQKQCIFCHGIIHTHVTWHSNSTSIFTMLYRITGSIEFVSLEGPEVILSLTGKFWHRRGKGRQPELIPCLHFIIAYANPPPPPPPSLAYLSCAYPCCIRNCFGESCHVSQCTHTRVNIHTSLFTR